MNGKRNPMLLVADIIVGIFMIIVALVLHLVLPSIPFALLLVGGVLLLITTVAKRGQPEVAGKTALALALLAVCSS